jgi:hypothetical protein
MPGRLMSISLFFLSRPQPVGFSQYSIPENTVAFSFIRVLQRCRRGDIVFSVSDCELNVAVSETSGYGSSVDAILGSSEKNTPLLLVFNHAPDVCQICHVNWGCHQQHY